MIAFSLKRVSILYVLLFFIGISAWGSGYEFEGIGVRHVSRAGAATADADDWAALYWNPASLPRQNENRFADIGFEIFGGNAHAHDSNSLSGLPGIGAIFNETELDSPFILGAFGSTIRTSENTAFGLGVYTPLLQGADVNNAVPAIGTAVDYESSAGILTTALTFGIQMTPTFSLGTGLNLLYGEIESDIWLQTPTATLVSNLEGDGMALEGVLSMRWDFHEQWSMGAIYRSGGDVSLRGNATTKVVETNYTESTDFRFDLRHPPTTALGFAYRPSENWTGTFDVTQTYWNRFSNEIRYDRQGVLQTNLPNSFDWENTYKIKLGSRWQISDQTEFFAGYSYDRPGVDSGSIDFSTTIDVPMHRGSLGWGQQWSERFGTAMGIIAGAGTREEGGTAYMLSGWQGMLEATLRY